MAFKKEEVNTLRVLLLVLLTLPLIRTTNIDCDGKAFHCVNSTHFMICVDIGRGFSSTVDDFLIPCPTNTECRITNRFECEYPPVTTLSSTYQPTEVTSDIKLDTTTSWKLNNLVLQTTDNPLNIKNYNDAGESAVPEEGVTMESVIPLHTSKIQIATEKETIGNIEGKDLDSQINAFYTGSLELSTAISRDSMDVNTMNTSKTIPSAYDVSTTETTTQLDQSTITEDMNAYSSYDTISTQSLIEFTTDKKDFFDMTTERLSNANLALIIGSGPIFANDSFAFNIHTKNKTVFSETYAISGATSTDGIEVVSSNTNLESNTVDKNNIITTTESIKLNSDKTKLTIRDISYTSPVDIILSTSTDTLQSSTLLSNNFNGVFTTEEMIDMDLLSSTLPQNTERELETYSTIQPNEEERLFYNKQKTEDKEITTVLHQLSPTITLPSSTTHNEATTTTLDYAGSTNSDFIDFTTNSDFTESQFLTTTLDKLDNVGTQQFISQDMETETSENIRIPKINVFEQAQNTVGELVTTSSSYFDDQNQDLLSSTLPQIMETELATYPTIQLNEEERVFYNTEMTEDTEITNVKDFKVNVGGTVLDQLSSTITLPSATTHNEATTTTLDYAGSTNSDFHDFTTNSVFTESQFLETTLDKLDNVRTQQFISQDMETETSENIRIPKINEFEQAKNTIGELVTTSSSYFDDQNHDLLSSTLPQIMEREPATYSTIQPNEEERVFYNTEMTEDTEITNVKDFKENIRGSVLDQLSSTMTLPSGTTHNEATTTSLDYAGSTNSDFYDFTTNSDFTESQFLETTLDKLDNVGTQQFISQDMAEQEQQEQKTIGESVTTSSSNVEHSTQSIYQDIKSTIDLLTVTTVYEHSAVPFYNLSSMSTEIDISHKETNTINFPAIANITEIVPDLVNEVELNLKFYNVTPSIYLENITLSEAVQAITHITKETYTKIPKEQTEDPTLTEMNLTENLKSVVTDIDNQFLLVNPTEVIRSSDIDQITTHKISENKQWSETITENNASRNNLIKIKEAENVDTTFSSPMNTNNFITTPTLQSITVDKSTDINNEVTTSTDNYITDGMFTTLTTAAVENGEVTETYRTTSTPNIHTMNLVTNDLLDAKFYTAAKIPELAVTTFESIRVDGKIYDGSMTTDDALHSPTLPTEDYTVSSQTVLIPTTNFLYNEVSINFTTENTKDTKETLNYIKQSQPDINDNFGTSSRQYVSTTTTQSTLDLTTEQYAQQDSLSSATATEQWETLKTERATPSTNDPMITAENISFYDTDLVYFKVQNTTASEFVVSQSPKNIKVKTAPNSATRIDGALTKLNSESNIQHDFETTTISMINSVREQSVQNFTVNFMTTSTNIPYQSTKSLNHRDFSTVSVAETNRNIDTKIINTDFSTQTVVISETKDTVSGDIKQTDTMPDTGHGTSITDYISNITIDLTNVASNMSDDNKTQHEQITLKENKKQTQNSTLFSHSINSQKGNTTLNTVRDVRNEVAMNKNLPPILMIDSQNHINEINLKGNRSNNSSSDASETQQGSGDIHLEKEESKRVYDPVSNMRSTISTFEVGSSIPAEEPVKTPFMSTSTYAVSIDKPLNLLKNEQNTAQKQNTSDSIFETDSFKLWVNKTERPDKYLHLSQTTVNPVNKNQPIQHSTRSNVQINDANNSTLHNNDQNIKVNFDCLYRYRGKYADSVNCRKFYICIGKQNPIIGMCPINTVFSDIRKQCTKNLSHCVRNYVFYCTSEGRFSDLFVDNIYYLCVRNYENRFVRFMLQCENGYHLDKASIQCIPDAAVTTQLSSSNCDDSKKSSDISVSKTNSNESEKDSSKNSNFICEREGKFADPIHLRKYYVCSKNRKMVFKRKLKSCDSDEVFDKHKLKCVDADSSES